MLSWGAERDLRHAQYEGTKDGPGVSAALSQFSSPSRVIRGSFAILFMIDISVRDKVVLLHWSKVSSRGLEDRTCSMITTDWPQEMVVSNDSYDTFRIRPRPCLTHPGGIYSIHVIWDRRIPIIVLY